ncbi:peptidylprolyl isomerase (plasmid) [Phormidium yuhuli AB48]|uniref:peptidylprolyl isomerase n=1 Tax=Phormidium yuhuli AB48 TaxID=2940671 RepID=A0ABY5AVF8_9CYAN|nr:peptidylprolyl isomerase [Phormidium yuhuli]USR93269.1 peptidylprolyl isomerase [Phormidium yuhuli AB48]
MMPTPVNETVYARLQIEDRGTIELELNGEHAPLTVGNFVDLIQRGFYDGITFHRVVPNFVFQAGDPNSKDPDFPTNMLGREGFTDPETGERRTIPLEIKPQGADEPLVGERFRDAGITVPPVLRNSRGTIAMARGNDPNSASSQFYFNRVNNHFLDGDYAVFGAITNGLPVMDSIEVGDRIESIVMFTPEPEPPPTSEPEPEPEPEPELEPPPPPPTSDLIPLQFWRLPPGDRTEAMRQMPHTGKQLQRPIGHQFKGIFRLTESAN